MSKIFVWKESRDSAYYRLQVEGIDDGRNRRKILNKLADWKPAGHGANATGQVHIFVKSFESRTRLVEWAKEFPHEIFLINRKGDHVSINKKKR